MGILIYMDSSSVWIEGMRKAAADRGKVPDVWAAIQHNIVDDTWSIDFGKLFLVTAGDNQIIKRLCLFGPRPKDKDSFWRVANGESLRQFFDQENASEPRYSIKANVITQLMADFYTRHVHGDSFVLVAGDRDYIPAVEHLMNQNIRVKVIFWAHATDRALKNACSIFVPLDQYINDLAMPSRGY